MRARAAGALAIAALGVALAARGAAAPPEPGAPAVPRALAGAPAFTHDPCLDTLDALAHVKYVDAEPDTGRARAGTTLFHFDQDNRYTYRVVTAPWRDSVAVTLRVQAGIALHPWHEIRLPRMAADSAVQREHLLRGLHDYVAISQDERPVLLIQWLIAHVPPLRAHAGAHEKIAGAFADRVIAGAIEPRYRAVVELVEASYARYDTLTLHGRAPLAPATREAFFAGLYDRAGLVRARFPYLAAVESLIASPRYAHARRPHCAGDR